MIRSVMILVMLLGPLSIAAQGTFLPQSMDRAGSWEASLALGNQSSEYVSGPEDTFVDVDSSASFGFGVHYNFNNHLSLGGEFQYVEPDYSARWSDGGSNSGTIDHEATIITVQLRGIWNILKGPLTPYLEASLGWTDMDSNVVSSGPPSGGCWWDPWWGYICTGFYDTYSESNLSYSVGAGGRWDISPRFALRGGYLRQFIDAGSRVSDPEFNMARIELLFRY